MRLAGGRSTRRCSYRRSPGRNPGLTRTSAGRRSPDNRRPPRLQPRLCERQPSVIDMSHNTRRHPGDRPVRSIAKPFQTRSLISPQPAMHRPPVHAPLETHFRDRAALAEDRQDCLIPLLSHAHVPHGRDCGQSAGAVGTRQPKVCDTSAERLQRRFTRTNTVKRWAGQDSNLGPWGYEPPALTG